MKCRTLLLTLLAVLGATNGLAGDVPTIGQVFNTRERGFIEYSCGLDGSILDCKFTQVSVRKKLLDADVEKKLLEAEQQFEQDKEKSAGYMSKDCESYRAWDGIASGGKGDKETLERYKKATENQPQAQQRDIGQIFHSLVNLCDNPTKTNWMAFAKQTIDIDKRTCLVTVNPYQQRFSLVDDSKVWAVIQQEGAQGPCGVINISRFERDKSVKFSFWNYFAQKVVTNKTGELLPGFKCAALDETEYEYNWKSQDWYMGCDYIKFGGI